FCALVKWGSPDTSPRQAGGRGGETAGLPVPRCPVDAQGAHSRGDLRQTRPADQPVTDWYAGCLLPERGAVAVLPGGVLVMRAGLDVLIVDDEPRVCEFVRDALSGCRVIESHTGPHALDLIRSADFDVVLLDLKMPGWGGLEVLRALAGDGAVPAVVILTGYGDLDSAVA